MGLILFSLGSPPLDPSPLEGRRGRLNGMRVGACGGFGDLFWKIARASVGLDLCFIGFEGA